MKKIKLSELKGITNLINMTEKYNKDRIIFASEYNNDNNNNYVNVFANNNNNNNNNNNKNKNKNNNN